MLPLRSLAARLVFCSLASLACASSACATKPTMRLNHAEISGVRIGFPPNLGILMTLVVDVYNPNSYDVSIRAVRGQVVIAGKYPLPVDFRPPGEGAWLTSNATTSVRVPVTVPIPLAVALLGEAMLGPQIPFHMTGSADVTATRTFKIEKDDYSVDEQGFITRQQIQGALTGMY